MKEQKLRVWWIPQMPMERFLMPVSDLQQAELLLRTLGEYDLFQYNNNVKPDYANAGGLEVLNDDGEWEDWFDAEEGLEFGEYVEENPKLFPLAQKP